MRQKTPFLTRLKRGDVALLRRLFAENARDHLRAYLGAVAAMLVFATTTGATAWLMRDVVDGIFFQNDTRLVIIVPLAMGALFALRGFANYRSVVILSRIGNSVVARLQRRLSDKVLALPVAFFDNTHSAELVTRMSHHVLAAREAIERVGNILVRDLLTFLGLLVVMFVQSPPMSLVVLVFGPIAIFAVTKLVRRTRQAAEAEFKFISLVGTALQETALGIRIVRAFNLEAVMRDRIGKSIAEVEARANKVAVLTARTAPIMETLAGIAVAAILLWAGYSVINEGASPGAFVAFVTAMLLAYEPAARLARINVQLAGRMVGVRMIYELLDAPMPEEPTRGDELRVTGGEIRFDRVSFRYAPESPVLNGLSFTAEAGQTTALVGPSGAGKTTIISLIERFYRPTAGAILVDGQDIATADVTLLRARTALVSQDVRLFAGTVRENLRLGRLDASDAEVEEAARLALADAFIRALPLGYDTLVGEQGAQFSGGQRQRLAIARALLRDARIVLLDEATSALDSESEHQVQAAFDQLKKGRTTIVVAHRLSTVLNADKICVLAEGRVAEEGTHGELLAAGGLYARLYKLQFAAEPQSPTPAPVMPIAADETDSSAATMSRTG